MISKAVIVWRGEYIFRDFKMYLKLRDQQLRTDIYIYIYIYSRYLIVTTNQKSIIDTHTTKKKEPKHNTKDSHQITRNKRKRKGKKDLQKQPQNSYQNENKNIHINNYLKFKWTKCYNQKT